MTKKDGSLMANLINPETKKIVTTIPLKSVQMAPEMTQAMTSFSTQMQMAQIAEEIQAVQLAVEEVRMGQEYDRLAMAYSCQQKLFQAMEIKNLELKAMALMQLAAAAEDSRNLLMLSQKSNVEFIMDQPENFVQKILSGSMPEKINGRISEIRASLCAVNMVSFAEAMAYQNSASTKLPERALYIMQGLFFFALCPENTDMSDILLKVAALNDFYSTNIFSVYPVAKHILSLGIDERLKVGDVTLVSDIQKVNINGVGKNFYSFATKYCSHQLRRKGAVLFLGSR